MLIYMTKFFKDSTAFLNGLFRGGLDEKYWGDINASKMRMDIREIILDLKQQGTSAVESETQTAPASGKASPITDAVPIMPRNVHICLNEDSTPNRTPIVVDSTTSSGKSTGRCENEGTLPIATHRNPRHEAISAIVDDMGREPDTAGKVTTQEKDHVLTNAQETLALSSLPLTSPILASAGSPGNRVEISSDCNRNVIMAHDFASNRANCENMSFLETDDCPEPKRSEFGDVTEGSSPSLRGLMWDCFGIGLPEQI